MKIAIYSPYLDTLGGGERYMMTIAEALSDNNSVAVLLDKKLGSLGDYLKNELSKRFSLNLQKVSFTEAPIGKGSTSLERSFFLKKYDMLFYLTDGSIFFPTSKKNILHIQSPLVGQPAKSVWGKLKLKCWNLIIYNSKFTKEYSEKNWPINSEVIYPPVDTDKIKPLEKKKYILSVGRFFGYLKDKKHIELISVFKDFLANHDVKDWSLHLAGSAGEGDKDYLSQLKKMAEKLPVCFYPNLSYKKLINLYGESSIYWHAAGFKETDPTKMEHFGIAVVEAMAAGCVPVVVNQGGLREIVTSGEDGFRWDNIRELQESTKGLITNTSLLQEMSKQAIKSAERFNKNSFIENIRKLTI